MKDELLALEARKAELRRRCRSATPPRSACTPIWRRSTARRSRSLREAEPARAARRGVARSASLIDEVRLVPVQGKLEIELVG